MIPFRKVTTGDAALDGVQDAVDASLRPINDCPLLNGALVGPITFVSGVGKRVSHGLERRPRGWFLVAPDSNANVWEGTSGNPSLQLVMTGSANITTSFWFF